MQVSLFSASRVEAAIKIPSGRVWRRAAISSTLTARAMNKAAGTPLSETSPTTNHSSPGSVSTKW